MAERRVVSLIASSTEIACALGLEDSLVGRSHECDYPNGILSLPVLTKPKMDPSKSSAAIDADVKSLLSQALSIYEVDSIKLKELAPDVILTQIQCEVCAVSREDVERALGDWIGARPDIVSLEPNRLVDIWEDVRRVAKACGIAEKGEELVASLDARIAAIRKKTESLPRPTVACIEWIEPLMAAGNWIPELVDAAGGINLFGKVGLHSPWMTLDDLVEKDPDIIVILPCGFDIKRTRSEMPALETKEAWKGMRAVNEGRVFVTDGNQYFNRPGPRVVESLEIFTEIIHPDVFAPNHHRVGWEPL
ncbi:MAG: cobalamin-binding protein [Elusimicrobia bacterium]|nr:MAG: cobalamin-binding protein [Elusimicrobiota bacterium]